MFTNTQTATKAWNPTNLFTQQPAPNLFTQPTTTNLFGGQPITPNIFTQPPAANLFTQSTTTQPDTDMVKVYKAVANSFIPQFYSKYNSPIDFNNLFEPNALITYIDFECSGYDKLRDYLHKQNVVHIKFDNYKISAQPGKAHVFIMTKGVVSITQSNMVTTPHNYSEVIVLAANNNSYAIRYYMFSI